MTVRRIGDPEVLQVSEVNMPDSSGGAMAVVRTEATSYNNVDAMLRREDFGLDFPVIPGSDLVGRAVSGAHEGKRVIVNPGIPCGKCGRCVTRLSCPYVNILGVQCSGAYGEYVAVPEEQCFLLPDGVSVEAAAAFPLVFLTSWRMLKTRAGLSPGQVVLIWGATGGLGSAAVAVCKALGGQAIAITRRTQTVERLLEYGADHVIDVSSQDLCSEVTRITGGRGVDIVFEGPGTITWDSSMKVVAQGGVVVTAGVTTGSHASLDIEDLYYRQITILGSRMGYADEFSAVLAELARGGIRPLISSVRGLSDARSVHESVASSMECGKIVMMYDL